MLRLFYLYLVINTNLRVNCLFDLNQLPHTIETSQEYPAETLGTQHLWSSLNSATTSRTDHGKTDTMFGGATYNPEHPSTEVQFLTVEKSSIDDSGRLKNQIPVKGDGRTIGQKRKSRKRLTGIRDQANAQKMGEVPGKSSQSGDHQISHMGTQNLHEQSGATAQGNTQMQFGQGAATFWAGYGRDEMGRNPSVPQLAPGRNFEADNNLFNAAYFNYIHRPILSGSNAYMDPMKYPSFPNQATGFEHTGGHTYQLHALSDKDSGTMQPFQQLGRMDGSSGHHLQDTGLYSRGEFQQFFEKNRYFSQTLDGTNEVEKSSIDDSGRLMNQIPVKGDETTIQPKRKSRKRLTGIRTQANAQKMGEVPGKSSQSGDHQISHMGTQNLHEQSGATAQGNTQMQFGQGAATFWAGYGRDEMGRNPSVPQLAPGRNFEADNNLFNAAYSSNMHRPILSGSNAYMDPMEYPSFPNQARGFGHTGRYTYQLHALSDKDSGTMLKKMDGDASHHSQDTGVYSREDPQHLFENSPSRDSEVFSQTRDGTDEIEMSLEEPYVKNILKLPPAEKRWKFSEHPANVEIPAAFQRFYWWKDPESAVKNGNVCTLKSNMHAFLTFKISQGLEEKGVIITRIIDLFTSLWSIQSSVAEFLNLQDRHALQIKSFETLASILQHDQYAMSPQDLPKAQLYEFGWVFPYSREASKGARQIGLAFGNQYFKIYHCIFAHRANLSTKQRLLADVTWAMLKDYSETKNKNYGETERKSIMRLALEKGSMN